MEFRSIPRAMLAVAAVGVAILAGIGTAGSFGGVGSLWGDQYDPDSSTEETVDRGEIVLRAPAIRATVDSVVGVYEEAVNAGEHDAVASLYASDAVSSRPGAPATEGRASIRRALERAFPADATLEITSADVRVLSPEWASVYGSAAITGTGMAGADRDGGERPVTFFALLRKGGDGWKVAREAVSSNR